MKKRGLSFAIFVSLLVAVSYFSSESLRAESIDRTPIGPLQGATVMVTTTADSGMGSLRAAITAANQTANTTIQFNIPNTDTGFQNGVFTINVLTPLPSIDMNGTIIDGATQTTATGNTNTAGPEVVINGSLISGGATANGLVVNSDSNAIRSLVIINFPGSGILIADAGMSNAVRACYIGTTADGTDLAGNQVGITLSAGANMNTIGGAGALANVISGNLSNGIAITGAGTDSNSVIGNFIGVDATSNRNQLPNFGSGIAITGGAKNNTIGGAMADQGNVIGGNIMNGILITGAATTGNTVQSNSIGALKTGAARGNGQSGIVLLDSANANVIGGVGAGNAIAFNTGNGITVGGSATAAGVIRNKLTRNSIFLNGGIGIDLGNDGVTDNDATDADTGANTAINFPLITNATSDGTNITVIGSVNTVSPNTTVVEIFTSNLPSPGGDPSGFGEGQTFAAMAVPNAAGMFTSTFASSASVVITATTTDAVGNTSEFSPVFVIGTGQPDLIVTGLTVTPETVLAGGTVRTQFSIRNMGSISSTAARIDIVLSNDSTIDDQDTVIASVSSGALAPGASQSFSVDITIPAQGTMGNVFIGVIADALGAVTESAEDNNTAGAQINVISMPDLTVRNLTVNPLSANPGDIVRIDFAINNQGSANAGPHVEEVRLSTDQIITSDDILLQSLTSSGIGAGATTQFVLNIQIPNNVAPGIFFIGVFTDARNTVMETSETNNTATASITISGEIDLAPSELTLTPNSAAPGSQVAVSFRLTNRGTLAAPISMNEIRLSSDQNITSADPLLGRVSTNPLAAGQSTIVTFTATIPTGTTPGIFFIGVIADAQSLITESNENNNIAAAALTIADQAAPRVTVQSPQGGEMVIAGENFTIMWTSVDDVAVITQDIFLSLDGGATFTQVIATGLSGTAGSFIFSVPASLNTATARVQVVARDGAGNVGRGSSGSNFSIGPRPVLISPQINSRNGKLKFVAPGSNIVTGAVLIVVNGTSRESFPTTINNSGSRFIIKGRTQSSPSGIALRDAIPQGVTVQLIVRNPNGIESNPVSFQR